MQVREVPTSEQLLSRKNSTMKLITFASIAIFSFILLLCAPKKDNLSSFSSFGGQGPGEAAAVGFVHGMIAPFTAAASLKDADYVIQQPSSKWREPYTIGWVVGLLYFGFIVFYRDRPKQDRKMVPVALIMPFGGGDELDKGPAEPPVTVVTPAPSSPSRGTTETSSTAWSPLVQVKSSVPPPVTSTLEGSKQPTAPLEMVEIKSHPLRKETVRITLRKVQPEVKP